MQLRPTDLQVVCLALAAVLIAIAGFDAFAHKGATGIVKERMDAMKSIGKSMKAMNQMFNGEAPYDAEKIKKAARVIKKHAGKSITNLFPKNSMDHPTEATEEIWREWPQFEASAMRLQTYAAVLEESAERASSIPQPAGLSALSSVPEVTSPWLSADELDDLPPRAVFLHVARTCKSCHEAFRKKKE